MKKDIYAVYDYGMGGIWALIHARSKEEIEQKFPALIAFDSRPQHITDEDEDIIRRNRYCDIDSEPTGWFKEVKTYESKPDS